MSNASDEAALEGRTDEVAELVARLHATEQRLEELTGGQIDSVSGGSGRPFLLRRAQEEIRQNEAKKQAGILDALPAHIALLDEQGIIVSVNAAWLRFGGDNSQVGAGGGIGDNYLAVCDRAGGANSSEASEAAKGIRSVLGGGPLFALEYPCHSPREARWFLMTVSPLVGARGRGAVVMHLNITERRQAERELKDAKLASVVRDSEERYEFLADSVPMIIWSARWDGSEERFNKAWVDYTGLAADVTKESGWKKAVHPADLPNCVARWKHAFEIGGDFEAEYRLQRASDGAFRWFLGRAWPRRNERGAIIQWIGTCTDIDDQKRINAELESRVAARTHELSTSIAALRDEIAAREHTETELRTSNEKFHQLADNISDAFWVRSPDMQEVQYVSPAFERIWGRTVASLHAAPREWSDFVAPEDRERVKAEFVALKGEKRTMDIQYRIVRPDGEIRWVRTRGFQIRDANDVVIRHAGVVTDITERKQSDDALRASEHRFKALFEQAAVGVVQEDAATGRFMLVNRRFGEIVGWSPEELGQMSFDAVTAPGDMTKEAETIRQLRTGAIREYTTERQCLRPDGSDVWISLTVSAMWAPGETPTRTIAIVQDISARKKLEDQFRQAQKMEAVGTLAGGIAHDFNNILAAIGGYTELSLMMLKDNPAVREHLGAVLQAASRATDLVRQILTFSRQQPINRRPIPLSPIVGECLKLLRATIPTTINFEIALATDAPHVLADATQVHQVMMNLGTNAWQAMKDQPGRLEVKLERFEVDEALAAAQPRLRVGTYARISFTDTGCGMDAATQRRIFEPFFTTKMPGEGTGLGLAAVHGIMESHEGAITVHSQPGQGTVFRIYFPAHAEEVPAILQDAIATPRGNGERILVVDDEEMLAWLTQQVLLKLGYQAEVATQPDTALVQFRANPDRFALVITDQAMPGMNGLAFARELRAIRPEMTILLTTGYTVSLTPDRIKAAGISQVLLKPMSMHALGTAVHAALSVSPSR